MKKILILLFILPLACFAQSKGKKLNLTVIGSGGIVAGQEETVSTAQISGGISHGAWFYGVGAGVDYYKFNSIPVFADWRFSFGPKRILYLYGNAGYHFPADTKERFTEVRGGFFGDGGIGFRIAAGRLHHFGLSVGYRYKTITTKTPRVVNFNGPWNNDRYMCGSCETYTITDRFRMATVVTKLTWEFGRFANVR